METLSNACSYNDTSIIESDDDIPLISYVSDDDSDDECVHARDEDLLDDDDEVMICNELRRGLATDKVYGDNEKSPKRKPDLVSDDDSDDECVHSSEEDLLDDEPYPPHEWTENMPTQRQGISFNEETGPTNLLNGVKTPIDIFNKFVGKNFFRDIAEASNNNAKLKKSKFETSEEEMKFYIGFLIGMGIESKIRFEDYWSSDPFLENVYIKSRISRQRVRDISHNFHLNMIKDENPADKLSKVKPMLDICENFGSFFKPGQQIAVDQEMIHYKREYSFEQNLPSEHIRYKIKLYTACDLVSGYCLRIVVYNGKDVRFTGDAKGFLFNVVCFLLNSYLLKNHIIYTDAFYASIKLASFLLAKQAYLVGTIKENSRSLPKRSDQSLASDYHIKFANSEGVVVCRRRVNQRDVYMLSTITDGTDVDVPVGRGSQLMVSKPRMIVDYAKFADCVHLSNQLRRYKIGNLTKIFWKQCFFGLLNIVISNCFICYRSIIDNDINLYDFKILLFKELTNTYSSRQRKLSKVTKLSKKKHTLSKRSSLRQCFVCRKNNKKTSSGANIRTSYFCVECEKSLCGTGSTDCFVLYHS